MIKRLVWIWMLAWMPLLWGQQAEWRIEEDGLPAVPEFQTSVYDFAGILSPAEKNALEQKLIQYADTTSTQIVVATIPELGERNINLFGAEWAHKWGIGQKGKDNGILIIVAPNDRKTAIITGYGVEDRLTDALSKRIIESVMIPYFRQGRYYEGLDKATNVIFDVLAGRYKAELPNHNNESDDFWIVLLFFLAFVLLVIILSRYGGSDGDGGYTIDRQGPVIWGGGFGGFPGGGGFGGGSFGGGFGGGGFSGGFGGGGFGGGGASGSW